MTERPILFSGSMVRAILDGRKTQTRRVVKRAEHSRQTVLSDDSIIREARCPYGVPGDRLWVRESFSYWHGCCSLDVGEPVHYWADGNPEYGDWTRPKPSIHMPRWASRITLGVIGVRVERVQDITTKDAEAEIGNGGRMILPSGLCNTYVGTFAHLWDEINAKRAPWSSNPFVWVIEFAMSTPSTGAKP